MTRTTRRHGIAALSAAFVLALGTPALAWIFDIPFNARVNGHEFTRIKAQSNDCELNLKVWFDAPLKEYQSGAKNRNYHKFRTRVLFQNGKIVISPIYGNRAPGPRVYTFRHDTSGEGCWAKQKVNIKDIDIEGCRARNCKVKDFEPLD
jgi:hypothetical protein